MDVSAVANKLVELCRTGQYEVAQKELYSENAVSIEPDGSPNPRTEGIAGISSKGEQWAEMVEEVHSATVSDPIVAGNHFACTMINDITFKGSGRMAVEEVCVYEVADGKIVTEQFFYPIAPQA